MWENPMAERLRFLVSGMWRETTSGDYMPITNSSTGAVMAEVMGKDGIAFFAETKAVTS
jgi:hypothetical protein